MENLTVIKLISRVIADFADGEVVVFLQIYECICPTVSPNQSSCKGC